MTRLTWLLCLLTTASAARAAVILEEDFETIQPDRWITTVRGDGSIDVVDGGVHGKCLRIVSNGGYAYLSMKLDAERFRGATLVMSGMVKLVDCRQGEQVYATPKFHFGWRVEGSNETFNAADRWIGSFDWTLKVLRLDVPENCTSLVMDIGNQNGYGTFYVDDLKLEDTYGTGRPVSLLSVCNTGRSDGIAGDGRGSFIDTGPLDLHFLPEQRLEAEQITFYPPPLGANGGKVMVALRGRERPDLPVETAPVAVDKRLARLAILCAAAWADVLAREPCFELRVTFDDGAVISQPLLAGVDVGNFDAPAAYENWIPVWTGPCAAGKTVGVGAAWWTNPHPDRLVRTVQFVSAGHGVPLILALTYLPARTAGG